MMDGFIVLPDFFKIFFLDYPSEISMYRLMISLLEEDCFLFDFFLLISASVDKMLVLLLIDISSQKILLLSSKYSPNEESLKKDE